MSYISQAALSGDADFLNRIASCAAVEAPKTHQPLQWAKDHIWWIAASPGFAAAYESAVIAEVPNPGRDPAVISDGQILSSVQGILNEAQSQ
jgi:hypothetical protein